MTLEAARAAAAKVLGPGVRVHFVTGRNGSWWAVATLRGAKDPDGNDLDWAERLGFLTPVTVDTFAKEAKRQFGQAIEGAAPSTGAAPSPL